MVIPSEQEEKATTPDRFNYLPSFTLKWATKKSTNTAAGTRRNRNMEPDMNHAADAMASKKQTSLATPPQTSEGDGCCGNDGYGIEAVRPKLVMHLKINRMKEASLENEKEDETQETVQPAPPKNVLPWNLRTRRREHENDNELKCDEKKQNCSLPRQRNNYDNKMQKAKLRIELSKKEIEEDFMAMLGHPPPRKPNKRPKAVQNQLDNLFPGLYLKEITAKSYKVPESPS